MTFFRQLQVSDTKKIMAVYFFSYFFERIF